MFPLGSGTAALATVFSGGVADNDRPAAGLVRRAESQDVPLGVLEPAGSLSVGRCQDAVDGAELLAEVVVLEHDTAFGELGEGASKSGVTRRAAVAWFLPAWFDSYTPKVAVPFS